MNLLPQNTHVWLLTDGKAGLEAHCIGLAEALGVVAERRVIDPGRVWSALMPYGPIDPRESPRRTGSPIAPPFPDILIASGRRTLPYLRHVRKASGGHTFTVYMQDPAIGTRAADVICVPQHDRLRGDNVVVTLTSPHRLTPAVLTAARAAGDVRLAHLPQPRLALVLGGDSQHFRFSAENATELAAMAVRHGREGYGLMVTPSRRTPQAVLDAINNALKAAGFGADRAFVWDRSGDNPYVSMLGMADRLVVTGDSVNMVSEAMATGQPVYLYLPAGKGHPKINRFHHGLYAAGAARPYAGRLEDFACEAIDATPYIAGEVARHYAAFRAKPMRALAASSAG